LDYIHNWTSRSENTETKMCKSD